METRFRASLVLALLAACGSLNDGQVIIIDDENAGGTESSGGEPNATGGSAGAAAGATGQAGQDPGGQGQAGASNHSDAAPSVVSVTPAHEAADVSTDADTITIQFSEAIEPSTVTAESVRVLDLGEPLPNELGVSGSTVTITLSEPLSVLARYTVEVSTVVEDLDGEQLSTAFVSTFDTVDGEWGDTLEVGPEGDAPYTQVSLATNDRGDALFGIVGPDPLDSSATVASARWYRRATGWEPAVPLSGDGKGATAINVAINEAGQAVAVWAGSGELWAHRYAEGAWGEPKRIGTAVSGATYRDPRATINDDGVAAFAYLHASNSDASLLGSGFDEEGGWLNAQDVAYAMRIDGLELASDAEGRAILVFRSYPNGQPSRLQFARFNPTDKLWLDGSDALPASAGDGRPGVAVDADGGAMAIWVRSANNDVVASRYGRASGWSEPVVIDDLDGSPSVFRQSVASDGMNFIAAWSQDITDSQTNIYASRFDAAQGSFSAAELMSDAISSAGPSTLGMDRHGNAWLLWSQGQVTAYRGFANRYNALSGEWQGPRPLPDPDTALNIIELSVAPSGNAFAFWGTGVTSGFEYWAAPFQ